VISAQSFALANQRAAVSLRTRRMNAAVLLIKGTGGNWRLSTLPTVAGS
jgi:outer membrane protein TolC